jgi:hypothetical protein
VRKAKYFVEAVDDEDFEPFVGMYMGPATAEFVGRPATSTTFRHGFQTRDQEARWVTPGDHTFTSQDAWELPES